MLEPFLGESAFANHGQRVVEGQRLTQAASDIMLGWIRVTGPDGVSRDFYIRQLWDGKGSALVEPMDPTAMAVYAELCGWALAQGARPLRRRDRDRRATSEAATASTARWPSFAELYADQNERDYDAVRRPSRPASGETPWRRRRTL